MENKKRTGYPVTKRADTSISYFGKEIPDPYQWLEDAQSEETKVWVREQNKSTFKYLANIGQKEKWKAQLESVWNYEKMEIPFKKGRHLYFFKNNGLQNQSVLYRKDGEGTVEIFLDPNSFSEDGTISLETISFSRDETTAAYSLSEGGSDWRTVHVMDVETKKILESPLVDVKFSEISWKGKEGFYYSSYDKPDGSELSAKTDQHKLYYHKIGTPQNEDILIFGGRPEEKRRYVYGYVTEDERFLFISAAETTSGNELYVMDHNLPSKNMKTMVRGYDFDAFAFNSKGDDIYIHTNYRAPNGRLMKTSFTDPEISNWVEVVPEKKEAMDVSCGSSYIFTHYLTDAISRVYQYDYKGSFIREISLPGIGSVSGFWGEKNDEILYYSFTNFVTPGNIYTYDPISGKSELYWQSGLNISPDDFICEQKFYQSKDGTRVPMFITYKKGMEKNNRNPVLFSGYGGFNISVTPYFSVSNLVWILNGGIFAAANIRGGGEYGKLWHLAGIKTKKQNVFDDFIAGAEYLINEGYTNSSYLAIEGRSNGGLLVGACMTQRPELFKVAVASVGVLDMMRYHIFTAGAGWAYDYGTAEESTEMLEYLLSYSPVHNVRKNERYPATLITTADHDDRVVPAHSYKFIAQLQDKQSGNSPVLIRIDTQAGHGAGKPVSKVIEERADIFAFIFHNMGLDKGT